MALKQYSVPFVICPKRGNEIEGIVLNRAGVSNCQRLTYTQTSVEYPQGGFVGGNEGGFIPKSCTQRGKGDLVKKKSQEHEDHCVGELGFTFLLLKLNGNYSADWIS